MNSALRPAGSTRAWRRIVEHVFALKGRTCLMMRDGRVCAAPATTVQHIRRREHGGSDDMANLLPACGPCNYGERDRHDRHAQALVAPGGLTARQLAVVDALDALGLACAAGRRQARTILTAWRPDLHAPGADLDAACTYRRARGPLTRM